MALQIDAAKCPQDHRCPMLSACPVEAITQEQFSLPQIAPQKCIECGKCIEICGRQAVYKM